MLTQLWTLHNVFRGAQAAQASGQDCLTPVRAGIPHMVERAPGGDDSSDEFLNALKPSEGEDGAGGMTRATSTSRPATTEERIIFDRLGRRVHEPAELPPPARPESDEEASSEGLAPELLSSGSSVELPPGAPPAGAPPPVPIQFTEAIATRVAQAVSNAIPLMEGKILALIPPDWQNMRNITLSMRAMTPGECDFMALPAEPEGPTVPGPAPKRDSNRVGLRKLMRPSPTWSCLP